MAKKEEIELKIVYKDVAEIIPYIRNPRNVESGIDYLVNIIGKVGFINPVVIWKNNEIAAGHKRLLAAQKLGIKRIPTIPAEHLTEQQIKAYRLADNKVSEFHEWDENLLQVELAEIKDYEMSDFGFGENEDIFDTDSVIQEKEIRPYQFCHVLITFPVEEFEKVADVIKYCEQNGYQYEQSNN